MGKLKDVICAIVPNEIALKTPNAEVRYKNIPERVGCTPSNKPAKEKCFKLTDNTSVCIVEDV